MKLQKTIVSTFAGAVLATGFAAGSAFAEDREHGPDRTTLLVTSTNNASANSSCLRGWVDGDRQRTQPRRGGFAENACVLIANAISRTLSPPLYAALSRMQLQRLPPQPRLDQSASTVDDDASDVR